MNKSRETELRWQMQSADNFVRPITAFGIGLLRRISEIFPSRPGAFEILSECL